MFCPNCGEKLPEGSRFCGSCGTNLSSLNINNTDTSGEEDISQEQHIHRQGMSEQSLKDDSASKSEKDSVHSEIKGGRKWVAALGIAAAAVILISIARFFGTGSGSSTMDTVTDSNEEFIALSKDDSSAESDESGSEDLPQGDINEESASDSLTEIGEDDTANATETAEFSEGENSEIASAETTENIKWYYAYDYTEGLAWLRFSVVDEDDNYTSYRGIIDKSGNMIFRINCSEESILSVTPYSNGYSHLTYSERMDVIDTQGKVTASYVLDDDHSIPASGDGYVLVEEHQSGFDYNTYVYTIYSPTGEVLNAFEFESSLKYVYYYGKGIFQLGDYLYVSSQDTTISIDGSEFGQITFYDDIAAVRIDYCSDDPDGYRGKLILLDSDGQISEVGILPEYGWRWYENKLAVKNGLCILYDSGGSLITYNIADQTFKVMSEEESSIIQSDYLPSKLMFDAAGRIALPLDGADGKDYIALYDTEWNRLMDPIQLTIYANYIPYACSDGRLIVDTDDGVFVYDENGELVYSFLDTGFYGISAYSDGAACVSAWAGRYQYANVHNDGDYLMQLNEESPAYLDLDGNLLFETIDMSNVIEY